MKMREHISFDYPVKIEYWLVVQNSVELGQTNCLGNLREISFELNSVQHCTKYIIKHIS